jgi:glycine/D-amino acid oxidase-like deaminating enzyme
MYTYTYSYTYSYTYTYTHIYIYTHIHAHTHTVWTPHDGDICPSSLTQCVGKLARAEGAKFMLRTECVAVEAKAGGGFRVTTKQKVWVDNERGPILLLCTLSGVPASK